jgi:undecaprenyl-diphosphatase
MNVRTPESPHLAFIVGPHVATALALIICFWRDWVRITGGFLHRGGSSEQVHDRAAAGP